MTIKYGDKIRLQFDLVIDRDILCDVCCTVMQATASRVLVRLDPNSLPEHAREVMREEDFCYLLDQDTIEACVGNRPPPRAHVLEWVALRSVRLNGPNRFGRLIEASLHKALAHIQDGIGVTDGGHASMWWSGTATEMYAEHMRDYIDSELRQQAGDE